MPSVDLSQLMSHIDSALKDALPEDLRNKENVKKISKQLENIFGTIAEDIARGDSNNQTVQQIKQAIDQFGNPASTSENGKPASSANEIPEEKTDTSNPDQPSPTGAEEQEVTPDVQPEEETPENTEGPEEKNEQEETARPEDQEKKDQTEQPPQEETEGPQGAEDDPTGFKNPAYHPATEDQPSIDPKNQTPEKTQPENTRDKEQQSAQALARAKQQDKLQQAGTMQAAAAAANGQKQQHEHKPDNISQATYPIILAACFLRDVVWITQLVPLINFISIQALGPLFFIILALIALLDRKFFVFLLKELFGIQSKEGGMVKKGAEQAAKKAGMAVWEIFLIILVFIVPYLPFIVSYHGKYIREMKEQQAKKKTTLTPKTNKATAPTQTNSVQQAKAA